MYLAGCLITSSVIEQYFYEWVPVLHELCTRTHMHMRDVTHILAVSLMLAVMCKEAQQCANKGKEENNYKLAKMDVQFMI